MGCYGADLYVPSFPITLPKLCVFVHVRTPREQPFERLTLRLVRGADVLSELVANPDKLNAGDTPDWARWLSMTGILAVTPFHATVPAGSRCRPKRSPRRSRAGSSSSIACAESESERPLWLAQQQRLIRAQRRSSSAR